MEVGLRVGGETNLVFMALRLLLCTDVYLAIDVEW